MLGTVNLSISGQCGNEVGGKGLREIFLPDRLWRAECPQSPTRIRLAQEDTVPICVRPFLPGFARSPPNIGPDMLLSSLSPNNLIASPSSWQSATAIGRPCHARRPDECGDTPATHGFKGPFLPSHSVASRVRPFSAEHRMRHALVESITLVLAVRDRDRASMSRAQARRESDGDHLAYDRRLTPAAFEHGELRPATLEAGFLERPLHHPVGVGPFAEAP
jgi:hypothetical protein